jgi:hypothetical protein
MVFKHEGYFLKHKGAEAQGSEGAMIILNTK